MNKLIFPFFLFLLGNILSCDYADAKTLHVHSKKTPKTLNKTGIISKSSATSKQKNSKMTIKAVVNRIEKLAQDPPANFSSRLQYANSFVSSTLNPYISSTYPAKTSLSVGAKMEIICKDVTNYVENSPVYNEDNMSWAYGAGLIAVMNELQPLVLINEIRRGSTKLPWINHRHE